MTADMPAMVLALLGGCLLSAVFTGLLIEPLARLKIRQTVREDGPQSHLAKTGTPSMGGVAFLAALLGIMLAVAGFRGGLGGRALAVLAFTFAMALVGLADDYQKIRRGGAYGFGARLRIVVEVVLALLLGAVLSGAGEGRTVPGLALGFIPGAGPLWLLLAALVLVGASNAVNLTDGLDGLAAGLTALCAATLALGCWLVGQHDLALLALAVAGVSLGFLWFNANPARVFMGDVGSMGLGAALGGIALAARLEMLLVLVGLIFVAETLSVIGQVVSFKTTGRRIFRMAPLHHHFELGGWPEQTVVIRFWIIGACVALAGCLFAVYLAQ